MRNNLYIRISTVRAFAGLALGGSIGFVLGVILYGILGVLSDQLASLLERRLLVWRREGRA